MGFTDKETVTRSEYILGEVNLRPEYRTTVEPARKAALEGQAGQSPDKGNEGIFCGAAIELNDDTIVTGKNSPLMHASSSLVLNAVKKLADIPDKLHLLSPAVIESIANLKKNVLKAKTVSLDLDEALIALSVSSGTNPTAALAMEKLQELRGCEVHLTHMPTPGDEAGLKRLGVNLTSEPNFSTKCLFES